MNSRFSFRKEARLDRFFLDGTSPRSTFRSVPVMPPARGEHVRVPELQEEDAPGVALEGTDLPDCAIDNVLVQVVGTQFLG